MRERDHSAVGSSTTRSWRSRDGLKEGDGGSIALHGSATLALNLTDAGLVDRFHLLVFPLLLGAGKRLFSETDKDKQPLTLVDHAVCSNGVQKQVLQMS